MKQDKTAKWAKRIKEMNTRRYAVVCTLNNVYAAALCAEIVFTKSIYNMYVYMCVYGNQ